MGKSSVGNSGIHLQDSAFDWVVLPIQPSVWWLYRPRGEAVRISHVCSMTLGYRLPTLYKY